jgi:membrane fusion protein
MNSLFRKEAMDHQSQRLHGTVILTGEWTYTALTLFFCVLILALVIFAFFFGFSRKETISGMVVPDRGLIRIVAPQSGFVSLINVEEGQVVQSGAPLFELTSERNNKNGATQASINVSLSSRIANLQSELINQRNQAKNSYLALSQRIDSLKASLHQIGSDLALQQRRVQLSQENAKRINNLAKNGVVSALAANEKESELIEQQSRLAAIELQQLVLKRELVTAEASRLDQPLQAYRESSQLERSIEELRQEIIENDAKRQVIVRAEQSGVITGIVVNRGQTAEQLDS